MIRSSRWSRRTSGAPADDLVRRPVARVERLSPDLRAAVDEHPGHIDVETADRLLVLACLLSGLDGLGGADVVARRADRPDLVVPLGPPEGHGDPARRMRRLEE